MDKIPDGLNMTEELAYIKYERAIRQASLPELQELFLDLLRLKIGRDSYFIQQFRQELALDVPKIGHTGYSVPLTEHGSAD
jgi:hypothetical protein